jgi:hypothetical protein
VAWTFVLCVLSKDKNAKCRIIKTKKQVRMKYREQENTKKKSGEGDIFRTRRDQPWGPPSLLYNGYRVSFPGVKRPGRGVNHNPPPRAEFKERITLHLYSLSGSSRPDLGRALPLRDIM